MSDKIKPIPVNTGSIVTGNAFLGRETAFLELKDILDKSILIKEGSGRATVYKLKR